MIHRLSEEERKERDRKIVKMAKMGCLHEDIARRYGLGVSTVGHIARRAGVYSMKYKLWDKAATLDGIR